MYSTYNMLAYIKQPHQRLMLQLQISSLHVWIPVFPKRRWLEIDALHQPKVHLSQPSQNSCSSELFWRICQSIYTDLEKRSCSTGCNRIFQLPTVAALWHPRIHWALLHWWHPTAHFWQQLQQQRMKLKLTVTYKEMYFDNLRCGRVVLITKELSPYCTVVYALTEMLYSVLGFSWESTMEVLVVFTISSIPFL